MESNRQRYNDRLHYSNDLPSGFFDDDSLGKQIQKNTRNQCASV